LQGKDLTLSTRPSIGLLFAIGEMVAKKRLDEHSAPMVP
jgi:hypothetical protein